MAKSKNGKYYQKDIHLGQTTLKHCSRINACYYTAFLSKINSKSKQEVTKMTDKHAAECSKAAYLGIN